MSAEILVGDVLARLRTLPDQSVHCVVTSPPYWGLRDYKILPSIWGGDPACVHDFSIEKRSAELRTGVGMVALGARYRGGGKKTNTGQRIEAEHGFCRHCAAWRGALGLEPTYQFYVEHITTVFREVWRVLRDDGTLWLNLGDCYATAAPKGNSGYQTSTLTNGGAYQAEAPRPATGFASMNRSAGGTEITNNGREVRWGYRQAALSGGAVLALPGGGKGTSAARAATGKHVSRKGSNRAQRGDSNDGVAYGPMAQPNRMPQTGLKAKDLCGIPWRVAFALQDMGWYLRRDIIWFKLNPMPEAVYDRPTTSHEYIFVLTKSGDTLCWRHRDGRWTWAKPAPDIVWRHRKTRAERRAKPRRAVKAWVKINLWRGFDYYYDFAAIMEPSSPDSHARAARSRSTTHKWADGGPGNQSIAKGSPVAGRLPVPAGWDEGEGRHGSIHRDGRRRSPKDEDRAAHDQRTSDVFGRGPGWRDVGIGHNQRPSKAVSNGAARAVGPNSRINVDRVPRSRKLADHDDPGGPRPKSNDSFDAALGTADLVAMRNKRSVWPIATEPFKGAHFAVFPTALIEPCILAGCPPGGTVLDPFGGAGTTGLVAEHLQRHSVLIERSPDYAAMARQRIGLFATVCFSHEIKKKGVDVDLASSVDGAVQSPASPQLTAT